MSRLTPIRLAAGGTNADSRQADPSIPVS